MNDLPLGDGPSETTDLASFDARQFLAKFPPEFIGSLNLLAGAMEHLAIFAAEHITRSSGGQVEITDIKHDAPGHITRVFVRSRPEGSSIPEIDYAEKNPRIVANKITLRLIAQRVLELGQDDLSAKAANNDSVGDIPADLLECLNKASECRLAICCLIKLTWAMATAGAEWTATSEMAKAHSRLQRACTELRAHLKGLGAELANASQETTRIGEWECLSAHEAALWISQRALDSVAVALDNTGQMIYASQQDGPLSLETPETLSCIAVASALLKLPLAQLQLAKLQKEAIRAANARSQQIPFAPPAPTGDGPWSDADTPSRWAKKFGVSWDTLKRRFDDGTIRHKKLSSKSYQIHAADLPGGKTA